MIFVFAFVMAYKWGRTQEYFTRNEVGGGAQYAGAIWAVPPCEP